MYPIKVLPMSPNACYLCIRSVQLSEGVGGSNKYEQSLGRVADIAFIGLGSPLRYGGLRAASSPPVKNLTFIDSITHKKMLVDLRKR